VQLLRATLPASIRIETAVEAENSTVNGDPSAVHQMLLNLCTNAFHAMGEAGGVLTVGVSTVRIGENGGDDLPDLPPGPYLRLSVADTGPGIDSESLPRIFEPYFTTKAAGEGTGLGLAMVHGIAHRHGGTVAVDGRPGEGAVFTVYLPAEEPDADASAADSGGEGAAPTASGRERLLVVDDEPSVAAALEQTLSDLGYAVAVFTDPAAALAAFEAAPDDFDALLTDMTMPEISGVELSARVRTLRPRLPVILSTGVLGGVDGEALRRAGASVLLLKPVPAAHLAEVTRKVLDDAAPPAPGGAASREEETPASATRLLPAG
jgi:CheY-like chemotaxis protein